jgi:apolipoprotein N-acyltransferase
MDFRLSNKKPLFIDLLSLISGAFLPLAFAPFNYFWAAFLPPLLALICWSEGTNKRTLLRGWLFGLGFFGVGTSWVYVSIHEYGDAPVLLASFLTFLLTATLALFTASQAWCWRRFFQFDKTSHILLAFPALWTLFDWIRTWFLTGFPWLLLGQSQTQQFLKGYFPIVGIYGVTFICVLISSMIFLALFRKSFLYRCGLSVIALLLIGGLLNKIHWTKPTGKQVDVLLVQGNVPQDIKWNPEHLYRSIDTYADLTFKAKPHNQLVIWAENAFTIPLPHVQPLLNEITTLLQKNQNSLITGIPVVQDQHHIYNAILSSEQPNQFYFKRHLVIFGEFVPFADLLRGVIRFFDLPMSDFSQGKMDQPLLKAKDMTFAPYVCYEIAYPDLFAHDAPNGDILLTVSNDTWFGNSLGPKQHLQIAQTRAVETQRMMVRATNNGLTAIINADGSIAAQAPAFVATTLQYRVDAYSGMTPLQRMGYLPVIIFAMFCCLVLKYRARKVNG